MPRPVSGWKSSEHANTAAVNVSGVGIAIALINAGHVWPAVVVLFGPVLVTALYTVNRSTLKGIAMSTIASGIGTASPDIIDTIADGVINKVAASLEPRVAKYLVNEGLNAVDAATQAGNLCDAYAHALVVSIDVVTDIKAAKAIAAATK